MIIIGLIASFLVSIAYLPQCIKVWKTHEVSCLSWKTFAAIWVGMILFTWHGINILDLPLILSSMASLLQNSYLLFAIWRYRNYTPLHELTEDDLNRIIDKQCR